MPMPKAEVIKELEKHFPQAQIAVDDLTGTADHYKVTIVSNLFEEKSLIARHQMVNAALAEPLKGPIHALSIDAYTPAQWAQKNR